MRKNIKKMPIYKELKLNQWLELEINGKIGLFLFSNDDLERAELNQVSFVFKQADVQLPLMVRPWQPGDKIQLNPKHPFTKKIARLFVDRKVPKEERQRAQVVCDANGTVLWLMGYATSVLLTEASQQQMNQENNEYLMLVFENN
ncbi:tRNA lysidine(34) synthetase TilS [Jeotgalibaca porci]|uniref:tRNA lysidine(34) synthetase TilS n=1 Tax=Jeotgalibaca porci TaxID=1868793 RepID=UPI0035A09784